MSKVYQEESSQARVLNNVVSSLSDASGKAGHRVSVNIRKKYLRLTAILLNGASQFGGLAPG
jgi:hypothetical protein